MHCCMSLHIMVMYDAIINYSIYVLFFIHIVIQWDLRIKDTLGPAILSTIERLSSSLCTVEPIIKDTLGPAILSTIERLSSSLCTVEPLNKGHIGTSYFVHYRDFLRLDFRSHKNHFGTCHF